MKSTRIGSQTLFAIGAFIPLLVSPPVFSQQSALRPASSHAQNIEILWWGMFWGSAVIFIAVMLLLFLGLWRGRARGNGSNALSEQASRNLVLAAGVVIPLIILLVLVGGSLMVGRSIAALPPDDAVHIRVNGRMWWWEVQYLDEDGRPVMTTANEIHVPVGRPVVFHLTSTDVIHSFWVPELHGKTDLVPGMVNVSWFTAEEAGVFRGQCAEFCGVQHALMAFLIIAEPEREFEQWLAHQMQPAVVPSDQPARQGYEVFISSGCADCHTVRGTSANGLLGPDLTHFDSRETLAAAARPNTHGHLAGWISDPQSIKPGNLMPRTLFSPEEHLSLLAFLESLD